MTDNTRRFVIILIVFLAVVIVIQSVVFFSEYRGPAPEKIGILRIEDMIFKSDEAVRQLKTYRNDDSVKAVVVRLDSGGGVVAPAQEIYEEIIKMRKAGKKVVASMASISASGAYYIACACDSIMANPGTLTGSIGVKMGFPNAEELMKKIGIRYEVVKSGEYKDFGGLSRQLDEKEREMVQEVIDNVHEQFINAVSRSRGIPVDDVRAIADGRIFSGEQALKEKLVDILGNYEDAIDLAKKLSGITEEPEIIEKEKRKGLLEALFGEPDALLKSVKNMPDAVIEYR